MNILRFEKIDIYTVKILFFVPGKPKCLFIYSILKYIRDLLENSSTFFQI